MAIQERVAMISERARVRAMAELHSWSRLALFDELEPRICMISGLVSRELSVGRGSITVKDMRQSDVVGKSLKEAEMENLKTKCKWV